MFTHATQRMYILSPITDVDQFKSDIWSVAKSHTRTLFGKRHYGMYIVDCKKKALCAGQIYSEKLD